MSKVTHPVHLKCVFAQVLSQGGDVGADQVEDTTAETRSRWAPALLHVMKQRRIQAQALQTLALST